MPAPKPLQPSKLYTMLRECTDARARAAAVLDFLVRSTGAPAGHLLIARQGELVVAASSIHHELPAQLVERARALWQSDQASHNEADNTRTVDARQLGSGLLETEQWQAPNGVHYDPRVLGIYRGSRWNPVAISVLAADASGSRRIRQPHVDAICNALIDAGDISNGPA
jgi:hypothetical protein